LKPNAVGGSFSLCLAAIDPDGVTFARKGRGGQKGRRRVEAVTTERSSDVR
jgi:hypothetical protein